MKKLILTGDAIKLVEELARLGTEENAAGYVADALYWDYDDFARRVKVLAEQVDSQQ